MTSTSMLPIFYPSSTDQQNYSYGEDQLHDYELASFLDLDEFYPEAVSSLPPTTSSCNQQTRLSVPNPLASVHPDPELKPEFLSSSAPLQTTIDYNSATYADDKLVVEDTTSSEIINEVCAEVISSFPINLSPSNQRLSVPNPLATVHHHDSQLKPDFSFSSAPVETIDYSSTTSADDKLVSTTTRLERRNEGNAPVCVSPSPSASGKVAPPAVAAKVEVAAKVPKNNPKKRRRSITSTRSSEGDVEVELERR